MNLVEKIKSWLTSNLNIVTAILRNTIPIVKINNLVLVSRFTDVEEVLNRPNIFGVPYAEKMKVITEGENFFLGMDNTPTYTRDVSNMRLVIRRSDLETMIAPMIEQFSSDIIAAADGKLDVVQEYTRQIPAQLVEKYFGIAGPTQDELIYWTTDLFQYLFFVNNSDEFEQHAISHTKPLREYLDNLILKRKSSSHKKDDIIGRCLDLQQSNTPGMSDLNIRNNMIGIIIGAIPTISKSAALVIDYILDNPEIYTMAQDAAKQDDTETIRKIVLESLRFNSFGSGIFRTALEPYRLARGTLRARTIPKGADVLVLTDSAMFDGRKFKKPKSFRLDRPDYQYMHFGYGMHQCFGYYINMVQLPIIVKNLLKCNNLRREPGEAGKLKTSREFPTQLNVLFDRVVKVDKKNINTTKQSEQQSLTEA